MPARDPFAAKTLFDGRAAGHSKPSMSLDVYTHDMPVAEVASERFLAVIDA